MHMLRCDLIILSVQRRYEREINQGKRPVLKRLLEQDRPAHELMVLQVCGHVLLGAYLTAHLHRHMVPDSPVGRTDGHRPGR